MCPPQLASYPRSQNLIPAQLMFRLVFVIQLFEIACIFDGNGDQLVRRRLELVDCEFITRSSVPPRRGFEV